VSQIDFSRGGGYKITLIFQPMEKLLHEKKSNDFKNCLVKMLGCPSDTAIADCSAYLIKM
jgi:hypothetical protein